MKLSRSIPSKKTILTKARPNHLFRLVWFGAAVSMILVSSVAFLTGRTSSSGANTSSAARARLSDAVSIQAEGRGKPWINMTDGHELLTSYEGSEDAMRAMSRGQGHPLSLATADFDEDGMPDLLVGYADGRGGVITLQRGNVDSVFPYTPEARRRRASGGFTDAPFISPARIFEIAAVPDFLLAGDFNADGHADAIAATRGSNTLQFLAGDGQGGLTPSQDISVPGRITAITSGEINRADGLSDLVVALDAPDGPALMVFEGPEGALKAIPEVFSLPSSATAIALGYLDHDSYGDVAIAAGNELVIVWGRDRKLSLDGEARATVPDARVSSRSFNSPLISLAIGEFTGSSDLDLAVLLEDGSVQLIADMGGRTRTITRRIPGKSTLATGLSAQGGSLFCARVSSLSHENLVMIDRQSKQLHVWMDDEERRNREDVTLESSSRRPSAPATFDLEDEPAAVLPMRLNADALSDLVVLRAGHLSPSVLTTQANTPIVVCTTNDCTGCGSFRDAITRANQTPGLDTIVFSSDFVGVPTITLQSSLTIAEAVTINGAATGSCSQLGEAVFSPEALNGIALDGGNTVSSALNITGGGTDLANSVIGRFTSTALQVTTNGGNIIEGNFIGLASDGSTPRGNGTGLRITSRANIVGGGGAAFNAISANVNGLVIDGANGTDNQVLNNGIGTTANGRNVRSNTQNGVSVTNGATRNTIGGSFVGAANEIAGSGLDGVLISSAGGNNVLRNQFDLNGRNGVSIFSSAGNLVGGTNDIVRNNFFTSGSNGVEINGSLATDNLVQGNFIGVIFNSSGSPSDFGNGQNGVSITGGASRNFVGGAAAGAGNLIALNGANGVLVAAGNRNSILSNRIFNNGDLPIRLQPGANDNQAPPELVSALFRSSAAEKVTPAATTLAVTLNLTGNPSQSYTIDFYLYGMCECKGKQTICLTPFPLGQQNAPMDSTGHFSGTFTFNVPPPDNFASYGFVNATATSPVGSTSQFAQCVQIGTVAASCAPICPTPPQPVQAMSASGAVVNYPGSTLPSGCPGVSVTCVPASGTTFPVGTTTVTCTATDATGTRGACSFTVTVTPPPGPVISSAVRQGKHLIVTGQNFVDGSTILVNGEDRRTIFDTSSSLIGKKVGKTIQPGDRVQVRNPDNSLSNEVVYSP